MKEVAGGKKEAPVAESGKESRGCGGGRKRRRVGKRGLSISRRFR